MNEQQQIQAQITQLKANLYDANAQIGQMTAFQNQFFGILAETLQIPQESLNDPDAYLTAVKNLVVAAAPAEPVPVEQVTDQVAHSLLSE
jgi:hypothetical protein